MVDAASVLVSPGQERISLAMVVRLVIDAARNRDASTPHKLAPSGAALPEKRPPPSQRPVTLTPNA